MYCNTKRVFCQRVFGDNIEKDPTLALLALDGTQCFNFIYCVPIEETQSEGLSRGGRLGWRRECLSEQA